MFPTFKRSQEGTCHPCFEEELYNEECKGRVIKLQTAEFKNMVERSYARLDNYWPQIPNRDFFNSGIGVKLPTQLAKYLEEKDQDSILRNIFKVELGSGSLTERVDYWIRVDLIKGDDIIYFEFKFKNKIQEEILRIIFLKTNILLEDMGRGK